MTCNHCGTVLKMRNEFCPSCGGRVVVSMDDIIASTHEDAARRHGEDLNGKLRVGILALIVLFAILQGFIYLYDRQLVFDGSGLPAFQANATMTSGDSGDVSIKEYKDPRPLPPIPPAGIRTLGHRKDPIRAELRKANGGGAEFDRAINSGLNFLVKYQDTKDGSWPVTIIPGAHPQGETADFKWGRVGVTGLSLLAFLGDGHTWIRDDNGMRSVHGDTVKRAVKFLLSVQDPESGRVGGPESHFMYNHAIATLALCEAAGLSGDAEVKAQAEKAVTFLVKSQTPKGGWDYYGKPTAEGDDISVSAWAVQALAAAREIGIDVPQATFDKSLDFYTKLTKGERGVYNFQVDDGQYLPGRSGMVLMIRQLLGDKPAHPDIRALSAKLLTVIPKVQVAWGRGWNPVNGKDAAERAKFDPYMMYFCSEGMFFVGGKEWDDWKRLTMKAIIDMQDIDGAWRANDGYSKQGGTCYGTALCVLALQASHRIIHSVPAQGLRPKED